LQEGSQESCVETSGEAYCRSMRQEDKIKLGELLFDLRDQQDLTTRARINGRDPRPHFREAREIERHILQLVDRVSKQ